MIIYRIFNKINGKSYIGQSVSSFNKRYKGGDWLKYTHNMILKSSVEKNGLENFDFEIVEDNVKDIDELNKLEAKYAEKYNTYRLNVTPRQVTWCIKKNKLEMPSKNYWQINKSNQ
jgi:hypothetical protein